MAWRMHLKAARAAWLAAGAIAVAGTAGVVAARGYAAPAKPSSPPTPTQVKHPKVKHGVLSINGWPSADLIEFARGADGGPQAGESSTKHQDAWHVLLHV